MFTTRCSSSATHATIGTGGQNYIFTKCPTAPIQHVTENETIPSLTSMTYPIVTTLQPNIRATEMEFGIWIIGRGKKNAERWDAAKKRR